MKNGSQKIDLEKLLREGQTVSILPEGYSMYPMLVPGRDIAILKAVRPGQLKRGAVVLYRRQSGQLVLHRIVKKNGKGVYLVGDNQDKVEGPLSEKQIMGYLSAFERNGKSCSVTNPIYLAAAHIWLFMRPVRMPIMRVGAFFKRKLKKIVCL